MGDYNDLRRAASLGCEEADLYKDKPATQVARPEQQTDRLITADSVVGEKIKLTVVYTLSIELTRNEALATIEQLSKALRS